MDNELKSLVTRLAAGAHDLAGELTVDVIDTLDHSEVRRVLTGIASPRSLIVKRGDIREVRFYTHLAERLEPDIAPRCYLAKEDSGNGTLVLEDLEGDFVPAGEYRKKTECELLVTALARLHGSARRIADLPGEFRAAFGDDPRNAAASRFESFPAMLDAFLASSREQLDSSVLALFEEVLQPGDRSVEAGKNTIVHGDAHYGNALYCDERAVLVDWGSVCIGFGEIDVAHAIAMNLPRRQRRLWERELLELYRSELAEEGFESTIDEIRERYAIATRYAVASAIRMWHSGGVPFDIAWRLFANATGAMLDAGK